jgi:hypothetical protein
MVTKYKYHHSKRTLANIFRNSIEKKTMTPRLFILFINDIFYVELSLKTYQLNFQIYVFSRYLYNYIYIN